MGVSAGSAVEDEEGVADAADAEADAAEVAIVVGTTMLVGGSDLQLR